MSASRPTHPRKGREGKGVGRDLAEHMHACNPTRPNSRPVENATAASTHTASMHALREIGGGCS